MPGAGACNAILPPFYTYGFTSGLYGWFSRQSWRSGAPKGFDDDGWGWLIWWRLIGVAIATQSRCQYRGRSPKWCWVFTKNWSDVRR